jgi:type VI secretion system protein ImpD
VNQPSAFGQSSTEVQYRAATSTVDPLVSTVEVSLLDGMISSFSSNTSTANKTDGHRAETSTQLDKFLAEKGFASRLRLWLGDALFERMQGAPWREVASRLQQDVCFIDDLLRKQVAAIIHAPAFQKIESSWRGVQHLLSCREKVDDAPIEIRILNVGWGELRRDFDRAVEFDQSQLFRMVYDNEFGMPGGKPYGALLADFDVHPRPSSEHPHDDIAVLKSLTQVAAASFCPIFLNASPTMFGVNQFVEMQHSVDYAKIQGDLDYLGWRQYREMEDSRFIGLVMPRMLMRRPYDHSHIAKTGFPFTEEGMNRSSHLWGGAVFAIGETLIRAFGQSRWLADIRGAQKGVDGGGLVLGPATINFTTDSPEVCPKPILDLMVNDNLERQMAELGFMSLTTCPGTPMAAFYSCPSTQKPKSYNTPDATANAKISSMLNYMLCVSRFAHYVKIMGRDKIGGFSDADDLQREIYNWIMDYVTPDSDASISVKSRKPLRAAEISVRPDPGKPGSYSCTMNLSPHYELDDMQASIKLVAEIAGKG